MLGHAPIGSFYKRFPFFGKCPECPFCLDGTVETREHILSDCRMYDRFWEAWLAHVELAQDTLHDFVEFLRMNTVAFTFKTRPEGMGHTCTQCVER